MKRERVEWLLNRLKNEVDNDHFVMAKWLARIQRVESVDGLEVIYDSISYHGEQDIPHCQTAGCLAGTYFLGLTSEERQKAYQEYGYLSRFPAVLAKRDMDMTDPEAHRLFEPMRSMSYYQGIKREHAIAVLERILSHGVIDWVAVLDDPWRNMLSYEARFPYRVELT